MIIRIAYNSWVKSLFIIILCLGITETTTAKGASFGEQNDIRYYYGAWQENAPLSVNRSHHLGKLVITPTSFKFSVVSNIAYSVTSGIKFGNGYLFKVTGRNHDKDPNDCGTERKVTYIIIESLGESQLDQKSPLQVIKITLYGGKNIPDIATLDDSINACTLAPYSRHF